jgi:alginate O-acetyltransferase complex protein AlgI
MLFSSPEFVLGFLPVVLVLYILVRGASGRDATILLLAAASFFFYAWWNVWGVLLLASSIVFNWVVSRHLGKDQPHRRALLIVGIAVNVLVLAFFKYTNFLIENVNEITGTEWSFVTIILPLGISFITFQKIAFLVDSYSGDTSHYRFHEFVLFASFFPQLIAGPIVHHSEMLRQFQERDAFQLRWTNFTVGLTAFSIGLVKKVVIADSFAAVADPIFAGVSAGVEPPLYEAWVAALAFALQIYFDFSGYSDMAIGLARMFGVRLPLNFNSPYKAHNIVDYWQRWHITLTRFLTDYIYTPLSFGFARQAIVSGDSRTVLFAKSVIVPLFITFLVSGLWHGAGWTFVIWGLIHFSGMATQRIWQHAKLPDVPVAIGWSLTILLVVVSLVFFRAGSVEAALTMLNAMAFGASGMEFIETPRRVAALIVGGFALCLLLPNTAELLARYNPVIDRKMPSWKTAIGGHEVVWRPTIAWAAAISILFTVALTFVLKTDEAREFIYFQF